MYISVEGIVGAGKSSVLKVLPEFLDNLGIKHLIISEPIRAFRCHLEPGYLDPVRNMAIAQNQISKECIKYYMKEVGDALDIQNSTDQYDVIISERSIRSPEIFIDAHYMSETFTPYVKDTLMKSYSDLIAHYSIGANMSRLVPDKYVFLDEDPVSSVRRVCVDSERKEYEKTFLSNCNFNYVLKHAHQKYFMNTVSDPDEDLIVVPFRNKSAGDPPFVMCTTVRDKALIIAKEIALSLPAVSSRGVKREGEEENMGENQKKLKIGDIGDDEDDDTVPLTNDEMNE